MKRYLFTKLISYSRLNVRSQSETVGVFKEVRYLQLSCLQATIAQDRENVVLYPYPSPTAITPIIITLITLIINHITVTFLIL